MLVTGTATQPTTAPQNSVGFKGTQQFETGLKLIKDEGLHLFLPEEFVVTPNTMVVKSYTAQKVREMMRVAAEAVQKALSEQFGEDGAKVGEAIAKSLNDSKVIPWKLLLRTLFGDSERLSKSIKKPDKLSLNPDLTILKKDSEKFTKNPDIIFIKKESFDKKI